MSNSVFPTITGLTPDVERSQEYDTRSQKESGGRDLAFGTRTQARYGWRQSYGYLSATDLTTLSAFVHAMRGKWDSFLYSDPVTPTASLWTFRDGIGTGTFRTTGNGAWTVVYMCDWNGDPVAADNGALTIRVNGVTKTLTTDYALDVTNGALRITFVAAPGNGLSVDWSGGYYRRCKFTNDTLSIKKIVSGAYTASCDLISQVLP